MTDRGEQFVNEMLLLGDTVVYDIRYHPILIPQCPRHHACLRLEHRPGRPPVGKCNPSTDGGGRQAPHLLW